MELQGGLNLDFITKKFSFEKAAKCHNPLYKKENNKQGFLLKGSGGSGKTIDALQFILYYCQKNKNKGKDILITRKTNTELVKTTLKDFIKVLSWYGFYNQKNHFKSHPQHYNFKGNIIYFSGMDDKRFLRIFHYVKKSFSA